MRVSKFIVIPIIGAFILVAWLLYNLFHKPDMTLIVRFKEAPPVIRGILRGDIHAYYRGYEVGKVSKIELSEDQKYILFYLDIYYDNLKLPQNTNISLRTQDLFGDRYFDLSYPANPSNKFLADGDVVLGTSVIERIDKYLVDELESGELGKLINNLAYFTTLFRGYVSGAETQKELQTAFESLTRFIEIEELQELVAMAPQLLSRTVSGIEDVRTHLPLVSENIVGVNRNLMQTNEKIERTNESIDQVRGDIRQASTDLRQTGENFDRVSDDMQHVSTNIQQASSDILDVGETIAETNSAILAINQNLPLVNQTVSTTNSLLCNTNTYLHSTNCNLGLLNTKIPEIPPGFIENADTTIKRYNCIGVGLSKMLSKRFLLFRFMFGNPGEFLDECIRINGDEIEINPSCLYVPNQESR
ncbi:MAG: hypothetical protein ACD_20C00174G0001 [uncultured bacterium]|nr:MAG: hypothetical protein ACD_20C00174G0001 [uncultured bacterium]